MPGAAARAPAHRRPFGRIAAAGGAAPAGCCLGGASAPGGAPPACRASQIEAEGEFQTSKVGEMC